MALPLVFSIVIISILVKIGEKLADKIGERLADKIGEFMVNLIGVYVVTPIKEYTPIGEYVVAPIGNLVTPIGEYLVAPMWRQLGYLLFYNNNIEDFSNQIKNLKDIRVLVQEQVAAAERKGQDILPNVREWLKSVNKIAQESSNIFNDEPQVTFKLRYKRSRTAKKMTAVVDELKQEGRSFDRVSYPDPPLAIGSTSAEDAEVFESRKLIYENIMEALKNDQINMIGICGRPGVGKTTLAKLVVQQAKDDDLFDTVVMTVVSQTPNLRRIQGEIANVLDLKFEKKSKAGRAEQILTTLKGKKRVLLILDNIGERIELEAIGIPFGEKHKGCKILLTSRSQPVCDQMGAKPSFLIENLSEPEGWNLFQKMAGNSVDSPDIKPSATKVAKECEGLPIAIGTLAKALKNKSLSVWKDAAKQLSKVSSNKEKVSALELSYSHLKSKEAKLFFLLCGLFPENCSIPIQDLFKYGMGLGLFQDVDTLDEARARAHALAYSLKSACLLQDGSDEERVKMHDVIQDVAMSIASRGKPVFVRTTGKDLQNVFKRYTAAISLMFDDIHELPDEPECLELKILLFECPHSSLQFPKNFFLRMDNLKVLDMSGMHFSSLPPSLQYLKNLRTLCLDRCNLKDISLIKELTKLEVVSFVDSDIKELPEEIGKLTLLRLLDLTRCEELTTIPPGVIQGLKQLEGLYMDGSFHDWAIEDEGRSNASLVELKHLSCLINLEIQIPDANLLPQDLLFKNLSRFKISIGTSFGRLEQLSYSKMLKLELDISTALKAGIKELLKKAEYLHLMKMTSLKRALCDLDTEGFPNLRCLNVEQCSQVEYIFNASEWDLPVALPILKKLYLSSLPNLTEICHGQLPSRFFCELQELRLHKLPGLLSMWKNPTQHVFFRNLRVVEVWGCQGLKNLFSHSISKDLSKLVEVRVEDCENMEEMFRNEKEAAIDDIMFPQLRSLVLRNLPKLRNLCLFDKKVTFAKLEVLRIINIENLQEIFHNQLPNESFSQLRILEVRGCHELSRVAPSKLLPRLKSLKELIVQGCNSMKEIFEFGEPTGEGHTEISLFQLERVELRDLPNLRIFCSGTYDFKLTSLETLSLVDCPKMQTFSSGFISTPKLNRANLQKIAQLSSEIPHRNDPLALPQPRQVQWTFPPADWINLNREGCDLQ
ncbi:hypothetical protein L1049_009278 [Liquidambar formosana]|uniref:AAA+ ATPase domain-containing protein n=1 Tax=Liquidambar formosana TaxID=63359 RepID=A0AAP0SB39_LIQFO